MLIKRLNLATKNKTYIDIALPILIFLVLLQFGLYIKNSLDIISETNKNNFKYMVKARNASEEIDIIVERAEVNLNTMSDLIQETYNTKKIYDRQYNNKYLKSTDLMVKTALSNSPFIEGAWFQINIKVPGSSDLYSWYSREGTKIINLKAKILSEIKNDERELNPEADAYYFQAIKNNKLSWSDIYYDYETKIPMISITKPIYKNNILIGVAGMDLALSELKGALKRIQSSFDGSEAFLLNEKNEVVLTQLTNAKEKVSYEFINAFKDQVIEEESLVEYKDNKAKKLAIMLPLSNKYNLIITFPYDLIYKGYKQLLLMTYFILAVLFASALVIFNSKNKIIKINKKLMREKKIMDTIFDASPNIILLKNLKGEYVQCNKTFEKLSGIKQENLIGKTDYDLFSEDIIDEILKNDRIVKETKQTVIQKTKYYNKDGEPVYLEKYVVPLFDENNELFAIFILMMDITHQMQEQELLQKAKEDAEKASSMKSSFLANMSHEIRTPMNGVLGFIQLLKETNLTEEQAEFVVDAQKSSENLLNIINDILDFSKIEAGKLKVDNISFDVRSIVEDITLMHTANVEKKGLEINSLICSDVPQKVIGDPGRIKQILINIVNNAIKFTSEGEIIIYVKLISKNTDEALLSFEVKDTGIGIPDEKLSVIFDEFTQADPSMTRKYGGTGLGLAISKKLAEIMNGKMRVESTVGKGSTFILSLPLKIDTIARDENKTNIHSISGKSILIINDNPTDLKVIKYYLNEANCIIYHANTYDSAIKVLEQDVSVILIDYKKQTENENEFISLIKENEQAKDIPVILYTSLAKRGDSIQIKEKGYSGYLTKPIKKQELIDAIAIVTHSNINKDKSSFITKHSIKEKRFDSRAKILVVEDTEINCKLVLKILNNCGLTCDMAYNGKEAIEAINNNKYDLIFMDCQMPILDGYEATKQIRILEEQEGKNNPIPVVAMTAHALKSDMDKCLASGMDDYISKPINIETLMNIIEKYIKTETINVNENENKTNDIDFVNSMEEQTKFEESNDIENIISDMINELAFSHNEAIKFFGEYLESLPDAINNLEISARNKDFESLKEQAHKLKGSSSNLRIEKIALIALKIEEEAANKNKKACVKLIKEIKEHLEYLNLLLLQFIHNESYSLQKNINSL